MGFILRSKANPLLSKANRLSFFTYKASDSVHELSESANVPTFVSAALEITETLAKLKGEIVVVKYGGNAMESKELSRLFCEDVATLQKLGVKVVVVHGGGPMINALLKKLNIDSTFAANGMRISTEEVVEGAALALCGEVNKNIANGICNAGGVAIGVSGRDARILECEKLYEDGVDIGNVGSVVRVNVDLLNTLLDSNITPVIAPIGCGMPENHEQEVVYNVNADVAAGRVAGELCAARVLFLTNIPGVLDKEKALLTNLSMDDINRLIEDGTITGGMIPKVQFATSALSFGVEGAFITDGRVPHALLNEVLSNGGMGSGKGGTVITMT